MFAASFLPSNSRWGEGRREGGGEGGGGFAGCEVNSFAFVLLADMTDRLVEKAGVREEKR